MNATTDILLHKIAKNFRLFLVDFPADLKPEHLDVPPEEQELTFGGLTLLRTVIGEIYDYFSHLMPTSTRWEDKEYCYRAIEDAVKLLWALGVAGQINRGQNLELQVLRESLDQTLKRGSVRDPVSAFKVLEAVGFRLAYRESDGSASQGGYKKCASVGVQYPADNDPILRAMRYYASRLPSKKTTKKGIIFEAFLRADFRPLLPGYSFHIPHLPATEEEVTRTFEPTTLEVWRGITSYMTAHHPKYRLFFRVPFPRNRHWAADYSEKDNDYGLWSIFIQEEGLIVRIVFDEKTTPYLLEHIPEFSPGFQESYLETVRCKDCIRCGKHILYTHGDHVHRLCKTPWYFSPFLKLEDLPDIERLIDCRLMNR